MKGLTVPAKVLFLFTFFITLASAFYAAWEMRLPILVEVLTPIVYAWLFWWWLREDSKHSSVKWPPIDLGYFVYIGWFAILPYHLFKTRGVKGFFGILAFFGAYIGGWLAASLVIYLVWLS